MKTSKQPMSVAANLGGLSSVLRRFIGPLRRRSLAGGILEHLGTLALTAQSSLALVRLHNETLLLGITPHNITVLIKHHEPAAGTGKLERCGAALNVEQGSNHRSELARARKRSKPHP